MVDQGKPKRSLIKWWILITVVVLSLIILWGMYLAVGLAVAWASFEGPTFIHGYALFVVLPGAAVLGTAQWWLLRAYVRRAWLWIPATVVGWLVGFLLGGYLTFMRGGPFWHNIVAFSIVAGLISSTLQWLSVRGLKSVTRLVLWTFLITLALYLDLRFVLWFMGSIFFGDQWYLFPFTSLPFALISGFALHWLIDQGNASQFKGIVGESSLLETV